MELGKEGDEEGGVRERMKKRFWSSGDMIKQLLSLCEETVHRCWVCLEAVSLGV